MMAGSMPDDPEVLAFIEKTEAFYPADAASASIGTQRAYYDALCAAFRGERPEVVRVEDRLVEADAPRRDIPVRLYQHRSERRAEATLLYCHGGGFVVGGLDSHDEICALFCAATGLTVVSVDYRLAPEHVYPAQLDDAEWIYRDLRSRYQTVLVAGDSAGGWLCASLSVRCHRTGARKPDGQLLIYPGLGGDLSAPSYYDHADAPMLTRDDCAFYLRLYAGDAFEQLKTNPEFAPLCHPDYGIFPPSAVFTADLDPLRDDGRHFAARLEATSVPCRLRNDTELVHGYIRARSMSWRAQAAHDAMISALLWLLTLAID